MPRDKYYETMQDGTQSQVPEMFFFKSGKCNSSPNQKIRKAVRKMVRLIRVNGSDQRTKSKVKIWRKLKGDLSWIHTKIS